MQSRINREINISDTTLTPLACQHRPRTPSLVLSYIIVLLLPFSFLGFDWLFKWPDLFPFGGDIVSFYNTCNCSGAEKGLLVDGQRNDGPTLNDKIYRTTSGSGLRVGNFIAPPPAPALGEIIAFAEGHPPALLAPQSSDPFWTSSTDRKKIVFECPYHLPVHVWIIVQPTFPPEEYKRRTLQIWESEYQGIDFLYFKTDDRTDRTTHPVRDIAINGFRCDGAANFVSDLTTGGYDQTALNIYFVSAVIDEGGVGYQTSNGIWCYAPEGAPKKVIVMGRETDLGLLSHEIGHTLGLDHVDTDTLQARFNGENVMHSYPPPEQSRQYLTEGQTFRAVFAHLSVLNPNVLPNIRSGPMRNCGNDLVDPTRDWTCPPLNWRIWADGEAFPPSDATP